MELKPSYNNDSYSVKTLSHHVFAQFCSKGKIFAWQGQLPLDPPPLCAPARGSCHSTCHRQMRLPLYLPPPNAPATVPATAMCACHSTCHRQMRLPPYLPQLCAPATVPATAMCACHSKAGTKLSCGSRDASCAARAIMDLKGEIKQSVLLFYVANR